jgi:hypothetical protein
VTSACAGHAPSTHGVLRRARQVLTGYTGGDHSEYLGVERDVRAVVQPRTVRVADQHAPAAGAVIHIRNVVNVVNIINFINFIHIIIVMVLAMHDGAHLRQAVAMAHGDGTSWTL